MSDGRERTDGQPGRPRTARLPMAAALLAAAVLLTSAAVAPGMAGAAGAAPGTPELVYVANADAGPVTAYLATSSGDVSPVATVPNPHNKQTFWDPWVVTFGPSSTLFVQSFLSDATTFAFAPGASTPSRIFRVQGPDSEGMAVDAHGYEYVMGGESAPVISVAAPGVAGRRSDLYDVSPLRQIDTNQDGFSPWPSVLAVDDTDQVLAAVTHPGGNAIEVFRGGPAASTDPVRTITGPNTGLGSCAGFDTCAHVSITYSPLSRDIYAAVSGHSGTRIEEFAGNASGDAAPRRVIAGSNTGLTGMVITGIAVSQHSGDLFVLVKPGQFQGPGSIEVFAPLARGDVAPVHSFVDEHSKFAHGEGIAIGG
jgi:hypothetical protein